MTITDDPDIEWFDTPYGKDCQCRRCGSSCGWSDCWDCNGVDEYAANCRTCNRRGGWYYCLSSAEWCAARAAERGVA